MYTVHITELGVIQITKVRFTYNFPSGKIKDLSVYDQDGYQRSIMWRQEMV